MGAAVLGIDLIILIISAFFCIVFGFNSVRSYFLEMNVEWIRNFYNALDGFFSNIWKSFFGRFISPSPANNIIAITVILLFTAVLILFIDIIVILSGKAMIKSRKKTQERLKEEKEKLELNDFTPASFQIKNDNREQVRNLIAPKSAEEDKVDISDLRNNRSIEVQTRKYFPTVRVTLGIIFAVLVLFYLFLRFVEQSKLEPLYSAFSSIYNAKAYSALIKNADKFFLNFFSPGFYNIEIGKINGTAYHMGQLFELLVILFVAALLAFIVLLIAHFVLVIYRHSRQKKEAATITKAKELDDEKREVLGLPVYEKEYSNIEKIAVVSPFRENEVKNKELDLKADYIEDISKGTKSAGQREKKYSRIPVSPIRLPLAEEDVNLDLSENEGVEEKDIQSLEDTLPNENKNTLNIETSFALEENDLKHVDLTKQDLSLISTREEKLAEDENKKKEDLIVFDEDGYSYLVKEGKPFNDEEEDIPDVIVNQNLARTALYLRFGKKNYDVLNAIEPFEITPLNFQEELKRVKDEQNIMKANIAEESLKRKLEEKPFTFLQEKEKKDEGAEEEKKEKETEGNTEEHVIKPVRPLIVLRKEKEENRLPKPVKPLSPHVVKGEEFKLPKPSLPLKNEKKIKSIEEEIKKDKKEEFKSKPLYFARPLLRKHPEVKPVSIRKVGFTVPPVRYRKKKNKVKTRRSGKRGI